MPYTILSVAYPLTPVSPDTTGGAEQVLAAIDEGLTAAGHRSIVLAAEGSRVQGTLVSSPHGDSQDGPAEYSRRGPARLDAAARADGARAHASLIARILREWNVDLIHMHGLDFAQYLPETRIPILATLHLAPQFYPRNIFEGDRPNLFLNCVSRTEMERCEGSSTPVAMIPNGVHVERFRVGAKEDFALAMGRICLEKGFHTAMDAARMARRRLLVAGEVFPYEAHREYFRTQIVPRLDERRRFIGPAGFDRKRDLLARARCLLVASTAEETSSLVTMEALASGTPVIAYRRGALPELIEHGRTGFLVSSMEEMAAAMREADELDPQVCRAAAEARFDAKEMIKGYIDLYGSLINRRKARVQDRGAGV